MQLQNRLSTPAGALMALPLATMILLLAAAAAAADCNMTDELPCEVTIPRGTFWWNYFDSVGDDLMFDSECGMNPPVDQQAAQAGATWVGFDVPSTPHHLSYEIFLKSDPLFRNMPGKIVVLDMVREDRGALNPVLELRLVTETNALELIVYSDNGPVALEGGLIAAEGSEVTVELTKSLGSGTGDASVRLRIDDQPWAEASCFHLWENLPNGVRLGVVAVESSLPLGNLEFQALGYSHRFFGRSK